MLPGIRCVAALMQPERFRGSPLLLRLPRRWLDYSVHSGPLLAAFKSAPGRFVTPVTSLSMIARIRGAAALMQPKLRIAVFIFRQQRYHRRTGQNNQPGERQQQIIVQHP